MRPGPPGEGDGHDVGHEEAHRPGHLRRTGRVGAVGRGRERDRDAREQQAERGQDQRRRRPLCATTADSPQNATELGVVGRRPFPRSRGWGTLAYRVGAPRDRAGSKPKARFSSSAAAVAAAKGMLCHGVGTCNVRFAGPQHVDARAAGRPRRRTPRPAPTAG